MLEKGIKRMNTPDAADPIIEELLRVLTRPGATVPAIRRGINSFYHEAFRSGANQAAAGNQEAGHTLALLVHRAGGFMLVPKISDLEKFNTTLECREDKDADCITLTTAPIQNGTRTDRGVV